MRLIVFTGASGSYTSGWHPVMRQMVNGRMIGSWTAPETYEDPDSAIHVSRAYANRALLRLAAWGYDPREVEIR